MPRLSVRKKVVTQSSRTKMLCPRCGHDEFKATKSKFSWLFGEKFLCAKCGRTFRKAKVVRVYTTERQTEVQKTSGYHKAKHTKRKRK